MPASPVRVYDERIAYLVVEAPGLANSRSVFVTCSATDKIHVSTGMRTFLSLSAGDEAVGILRAVLQVTGGHLCRDDSEEEWRYVAPSRDVELTPDQELAVALAAIAGPREAAVLVGVCSDPDRRAALEAALAARRDAEPASLPRP